VADLVAKVRCVSALTMIIVMRSLMGASDDGAAQRRLGSALLYGAGRGCIAHRNRHCAAGAQFRLARSALAREAQSLNGPTRQRPCRARVRAKRLFADPEISRDRRSANASHRPGVMRQSKPATSGFDTSRTSRLLGPSCYVISSLGCQATPQRSAYATSDTGWRVSGPNFPIG